MSSNDFELKLEDLIVNDDFFFGYELKIEISRIEETNFTDNTSGVVIYCSIWNMSNKNIQVSVISSGIINDKREQRERDSFLTGYAFQNGIINSYICHVRGYIFQKNTAGNIVPGWSYSIAVLDKTNGKEYDITFKLRDVSKNKWDIISFQVENVGIIKEAKVLEKEFLQKIERIEAFEEKLNIRIENISFVITENSAFQKLAIYLEVYTLNGNSLMENINIKVAIYDNNGSIMFTGRAFISALDFMGFDLCSFEFSPLSYRQLNDINRIRIFPVVA